MSVTSCLAWTKRQIFSFRLQFKNISIDYIDTIYGLEIIGEIIVGKLTPLILIQALFITVTS